jgi:short-subunit dehydrogenase
MDLSQQRIFITGAAGGIGKLLAGLLAKKGARLCQVDRQGADAEDPEHVQAEFPGQTLFLKCDITDPGQRRQALEAAERAWGGIDILINLAGMLDFSPFQDSDPDKLQRLLQVNVEAPMQLVRGVLPGMLARRHGRIVNVGSMFGSIGFPFFSAYSATKFALRGYSQALRRELTGSGVGVTYVSPRAVNTPFNPPVVHEMAARGMMHMDDPTSVATAILRAIEKERSEVYLGFPESFFARLNALLPSLVDRALRRQVPQLLTYASAPGRPENHDSTLSSHERIASQSSQST